MTPRANVNSRHAIDSCALQLHAWRPFHHLQPAAAVDPSKPYYPFHAKKPCRSDRSTTPAAADGLDFCRLSLVDETPPPPPPPRREEGFRWFARKRRRRGSRSVSGRSSDWSGTRPRGGASAAYATCSDFPLAAGGTDSSGELFVNGDGSWGSDVSEAAKASRREGKDATGGGGLERETSGFGAFQNFGASVPENQVQGNESGYGSEPGYRGDGELGYGDELDEEDDDVRLPFWGEGIGDSDQMEIVGENKFADQKTHHRGRRRKHDWRIMAPSS